MCKIKGKLDRQNDKLAVNKDKERLGNSARASMRLKKT